MAYLHCRIRTRIQTRIRTPNPMATFHCAEVFTLHGVRFRFHSVTSASILDLCVDLDPFLTSACIVFLNIESPIKFSRSIYLLEHFTVVILFLFST